MRRILLLGAAGLLLSLISAHGAWAFGVKDVVQMHRDGVDDSLIIEKIDYSGTSFHLDAGDLRALKQGGVSDEVISTMLRTEGRDDGDRYYGGYYYPRPRVYVGLGFGYYAPYFGGFRAYHYRPYYFHGGYGHFGYGRTGFGHGSFGTRRR